MPQKSAPAASGRALAALAADRHGVVSRGELRALRYDDAAIAYRVRTGLLHRLHRGVFAVGHTSVSGKGRWLAAVLACGDGALLSHRSAAALWGLRVSAAERVEVTVPRGSGVRSRGGLQVHRPRLAAPATLVDSIPVTTPGRTLLDLATVLRPRALEKAAEMAEALRLDVHLDPAHPGARRLRAAMAHDLGTTTRSELEDAFLELCDRHGLPRPLVNHVVAGYEVDFCWPADRLIAEIDGFAHHGTRAAFVRDRARDAALVALGWRVVRFAAGQVRSGDAAKTLLSARSRSLATPV